MGGEYAAATAPPPQQVNPGYQPQCMPPVQQPPVAVVGVQAVNRVPTETWEAGVCDCFQDIGLCCDVCFCTCCQAGRIYDAAFEHKPDSMNILMCLGMCGAIYFVGGIATCLFSMCMRDKVRTSYGIMGDGCDDCCMSFWCAPCVMCQVHRELSKRGTPPGHTCCEPSIKYPSPAGMAVAQPGYAPPPTGFAPPPAGYAQQPAGYAQQPAGYAQQPAGPPPSYGTQPPAPQVVQYK